MLSELLMSSALAQFMTLTILPFQLVLLILVLTITHPLKIVLL